MEISKENLLRINRGFGGNIRSGSSIDYAIDMQKEKRIGEYKKLAYLLRAVLVDHPFSDGNKRTAMFIALAFAEENKKQVDRELLLHHIVSIAKQNITDLRNIEWRLKNAVR
ncbi:MAG TPA: Fic family protein [Candidatus Nanoarchaeia archaeon]|nr:Fic family protein [Candidatus Nanoarchaeia archaeon]